MTLAKARTSDHEVALRTEFTGWSDLDELAARQDAQLRTTFEWAARSPFYRGRFGTTGVPRTRADLQRLAPTTKQDLRDNYPFGMLAVERRRLATYHESSGSAGEPTPSYYTTEDWVDLNERYARKWTGITADDTFLVRTPYALMVTGHLAHSAARSRGATVVPGDNRSLAMPYARVVRVLRDLGVTMSWSLPTETLLWVRAAELAGLDPQVDFPELRALFVGGEPLSPARKARISELWGVPVVEEYGSTETGSLAGECPNGELHLWADRAIFEVADPETGEIRDSGRGTLVVTPLYREAMPLLRYDLADNVEVSTEPCDCGWRLPTVRVLGRAAFGHRVGDRLIDQNSVEEVVFALPAEYGVMFWRGRALPDELQVQIEVAERHRAAASAELDELLRRRFGVPVRVLPLQLGSLVPEHTLTQAADVVKPRSFFGPDEDWSKALLYC
ncbi:phenylacetate--CoA ligase family protein [Saccharomonospora azurea]|uniref:Coenzyme F390 synthetase n=1 Tax=Saccharomonospora azurea NA-128 TaxID=882081 RepID=H8G470_9PSEU|nr:AMP-binding protein [Saccharomonospora azurea]EHY91168.1 coenzyme F390 synthetase [Saccharomonospora azurea NA-128]